MYDVYITFVSTFLFNQVEIQHSTNLTKLELNANTSRLLKFTEGMHLLLTINFQFRWR